MAEVLNVPMQAEEFITLELLRLVAAINQTDPRGRDYAQLLENIERFECAAMSLPEIWERFHKYYTDQGVKFDTPPVAEDGKEPEIIRPEFKPVKVEEQTEETVDEEQTPAPVSEEEQKSEEPEEEYDPAVVKSAIAKARSTGKVVKIAEWLKENWGVSGFTALPAKKYPEVMAKLKELEVI